MALKFGSGNTTRKLKLVRNDPLFGPRLGEYTHFVLCQLFNKGVDTYVWGYGHWGQTQSLTAYITSSSGGNNTGHMVTVSAINSNTATAGGFSGHPETDLVLYAIRGQGGYQDLGSPKSIQYTSTIVIGGQASGVPDLRQSPEVYGNAWAWPDSRITPVSDRPFYLGGDDDYYGDRKLCGYMHMAGSINRYLTDEELRGIVTGRIAVLDSFRPDIRELWDFSLDTDAALTGLIGGRALEKIGSGWAWEYTEYRRPASRLLRTSVDVSIGVMTPFTRGWGIGEVSGGGGADILNTTPAALTTEGQVAALQASSVFAAIPAGMALVASKATFTQNAVINAQPAALVLQSEMAGLRTTEILNTQAEALSLTPVSTSILEKVTVLATPANTVLSGVKSSVRLNEAIHAKPASIALIGDRADIILKEVLYAKPAVIDLTGITSSVHITSFIEIPAKPATISLSGVNAAINLSGQIQISTIPATITLAANSATLVQHAVINTQHDTLILQPVVAGLYAGEVVVDAVAKALTLTPGQATIVQHGVLAATPDNIALHGSQAGIHIINVLATNTANAILSGTQAGLYTLDLDINVSPSNIGTSGNQVILCRDISVFLSNILTLGSQVILTRNINLVIDKGDIHTLGSGVVIHTQADNLINIAYGSIEVLGSGVVVISGEPYDLGRRLRVTKQDYILRVSENKYVLRVLECL